VCLSRGSNPHRKEAETQGGLRPATCDFPKSRKSQRSATPASRPIMSTEPYLLTTYDDLVSTAVPFAQEKIPLMVLIGTPGLAKSKILEQACKGRPVLSVSGKKSPFDLFIDLHRHLDQPVILDDVDTLLEKDEGKVLLRQLTETTDIKPLSWGSQTARLSQLNPPVPNSFLTRSVVCLITNRWRSTGIMQAIESRAVLFEFKPSWREAYQYAGTWFHDQEVLDYVHRNLALMQNPDLRVLKHAVTLRSIGKEWRSLFDKFFIGGSGRATRRRSQAEIERLLAIDVPMQERVRMYEKGGFGDRATFFRHKKELEQATVQAIPPRIIVSSATKGKASKVVTTTKATASRKAVRASSATKVKPAPATTNTVRAKGRRRKPLPR
jgi:hypothetical protein